jgi:SAM-dependent methyltransferase
MSWIDSLHDNFVHGRRVRVLSEILAANIPAGSSLLDVGAGDGLLASEISWRRSDIKIHAIDTLVRRNTEVPVAQFDGKSIPCDNRSIDVVMFVDVLHHTEDPTLLLREAKRVARRIVIIKDHLLSGLLAEPILKFMDKVGNERHGITLPYHYWTERQWLESFTALGLKIIFWKASLGIYPWPANWIFERSLHFLAELEV